MSALDHRRILDHDGSFHPFRGTDLFARIGGQDTVDRIVDSFYERLGSDGGFDLFFGRDLSAERARVKLFLGEWLGGERRYSDRAYAGLAHRHEELAIPKAHAGRWLGHFRAALDDAVSGSEERSEIIAKIFPLAMSLVNAESPPARPPKTISGMCISSQAPIARAADFAKRGDLDALREVFGKNPKLLKKTTYGARAMNAAVMSGKIDAVRCLIEQGANVDTPHHLPVAISGAALWGVLFMTPLCCARFKKRAAVERLLRDAGARDDIFTAAFLGDLAALKRWLESDSDLAQASDPAADALDIAPLHHAAAGGSAGAVDLILGKITGTVRGIGHALSVAADLGRVDIAEKLIARGASGRAIGAGRWVLDQKLAPILSRAGAAVDRSGHWIRLSCTGNQGRKDDPKFVRALLRHGARADDRHPSEQATALHYAAKAGFLETIDVLLEHGADPNARDSAGKTPIDWLAHATKSVDREAVRRLLGAI